jgi:hypothetical protein
MQKQKLVFDSMQVDSDCTIVHYTCNFTVTTAGDGTWCCEAGRKVNVTNISVITNAFDDDINVQVNVKHNSTWDIYTDTAFETAISDALGFDVQFTEQGMQDNKFASLEKA